MKRILASIVLVLVVCSFPVPASAAGGPNFTDATTTADFDGNGVEDLAVGVPGEDVGEEGSEVVDAGAVNVIYGRTAGLAPREDEIWHQDSATGEAEVESDPDPDDQFGNAVAAGDFNGDGFDDLAIGAPAEDVDAVDSGVVHILYGSDEGLTAVETQTWSIGSQSLMTAGVNDRFGAALATGDFGRDRAEDLAIGVPNGDVGAAASAGWVLVLSGKVGPTTEGGGLRGGGKLVLHQDVAQVAGGAEGADAFGRSLAAADFGGGDEDDLAVGAPFEGIETESPAGAVNVFYGSSTGVDPSHNQMWHHDSPDIKGDLSANLFGWDLAAADLGRGSQADLAVAAPQTDIGSFEREGAVNVIYGAPSGLTASGNQLWHPGLASVEGEGGEATFFAGSVASGNLGRSRHADLAIGTTLEAVGEDGLAGVVNVLYGSRRGVTGRADQLWHQDSDGVADAAESSDRFGAGLAIGNVGKSGHGDLAVAVPSEGIDGQPAAGAVNVLYGSADGVRALGDQLWHQNSPDIEDAAEQSDYLGGPV